jgi:hypothetical protein
MRSEKRVPLYERLPEIYRTKDKELPLVPGQLEAYLALVEEAFGRIHENIEELYHDLFVETADDWAVPYIGDLLGTSYLKGDPRTVRADVADTIALRRRKGTLGALELLTFDLTRWGSHCVELRENMGWNQHLNHQRPDEGGLPPYGLPGVKRQTPIRGGTVTLRDPATLALMGTPFDPFAYTADVKPATFGQIHYNLPNLAIFLWRLAVYRLSVTKPFAKFAGPSARPLPAAPFVARFRINPVERPYPPALGPYAPPNEERQKQPVRLFNTNRFGLTVGTRKDASRGDVIELNVNSTTPRVSLLDEVPGPIPVDRLTEGDRDAAPEKYVSVETYDAVSPDLTGIDPLDLSDVGFQLHLPVLEFFGETWPEANGPAFEWKIRGENLCAWEADLEPPLKDKEIAIDPVIGRVVIGVNTQARADALADEMLVTFTYAAPGPVGAHPVTRDALPDKFKLPAGSPNFRRVSFRQNPNGLRDALANLQNETAPVVVEIGDSFTHVLDLSAVAGATVEDGGPNLQLNDSLVIRAASNQRPVVKLVHPLRFRPAKVVAVPPADAAQQKILEGVMSKMTVRLEGLWLERDENYPAGEEALIARAALNSLEIMSCTLDPGGFRQTDGVRAPIQTSVRLREPYGFPPGSREEEVFDQTPEVILCRTVAGPLRLDAGYGLKLTDSIIDAGQGVGDPADALAVGSATNTSAGWGAPTTFNGITVFGRTRVESVTGSSGIFVHALEAHDVQKGCVKFSYLANEDGTGTTHADRLPPNHACVRGRMTPPGGEARLEFTSEHFGDAAYGQLASATDFRVRERGSDRITNCCDDDRCEDHRAGALDDQMGAYGFLLEAHKWRNLQIRFREFMPVGVRPLLLPVT